MFSIFLSLIISFSIAFIIRDIRFTFCSNSEDKRISERYDEDISMLKDELIRCDIKNVSEVKKILQDDYGFKVGYEFYLVDEEGTVIESSTPGMLKIDKEEIVDGLRSYKESETDTNIFKFRCCDSLKDGYYLYCSYLHYDEDDTLLVAAALISSLICFYILLWGRISYISTLRASVAKMTKGDLRERIPYRYKNELRALAEDINEMAQSLESEERKKNEFLTNISHDIRTPLTTIMGYLNMIKNNQYDSQETLGKYVDIMERKGKFLKSMLDDFFQYSKLNSNDIELDKTRLDLNELLRQIKEDEEDEFLIKSLKLELDLYRKPIYCIGDSELLARVVNNLLSNAKKYSRPETSVLIKSNIEKVESQSYGVFFIRSVPKEAIKQEEISYFFERLYKRDSARKEEGSGLGLAISQNIIKLHDGKIEGIVTKEGLVFKIYIKI